jgi:hypothetical protein
LTQFAQDRQLFSAGITSYPDRRIAGTVDGNDSGLIQITDPLGHVTRFTYDQLTPEGGGFTAEFGNEKTPWTELGSRDSWDARSPRHGDTLLRTNPPIPYPRGLFDHQYYQPGVFS